MAGKPRSVCVYVNVRRQPGLTHPTGYRRRYDRRLLFFAQIFNTDTGLECKIIKNLAKWAFSAKFLPDAGRSGRFENEGLADPCAKQKNTADQPWSKMGEYIFKQYL